jgi:hypothetical protein
MPVKNGVQAIQEVKAICNVTNHQLVSDPRGQIYMPTFAMFTVHTGQVFKEYLRSNDIQRIIQKPPDKEEIFKIIVEAMTQIKVEDVNQQL